MFTWKAALAELVLGIGTIWLVARMVAFAICTAAGNGVCVTS